MLIDIQPGSSLKNIKTDNGAMEYINNNLVNNISDDLRQTYELLLKSGRLLSFNFITEDLFDKKLLNNKSPEVRAHFWTKVTEHCEIFTTTIFLDQAAIGLRKWIPITKKPKRTRRFSHNILQNIKNITFKERGDKSNEALRYQHKLSKEELEESYLTISPDLLKLFNCSGEGFQLTIYCYGDYSFNAWVNTDFFTLHTPELKKYFKENNLKPGDIVYTEKRKDDPTGIHLYTTWQIDQMESKINAINKESLESQAISIRENKKKSRQSDDKNNYDLVYLLSIIQNKDLVYKFVKFNGPSNVRDIAKAISKELGVQKENIEKLSFIDFSDARIVRLPDGRIGLREVSPLIIVNGQERTKFKNMFVAILIFTAVIILFVLLSVL